MERRTRRARQGFVAILLAASLLSCSPESDSADRDGGNNAVELQAVQLDVNPAKDAVQFGSGVEVSFRLSAASGDVPEGTATVEVNGATFSAPVGTDGAGSVTLDPADLRPGPQPVVVTHPGDARFTASRATTTVTVNPARVAVELVLSPADAGATDASAVVSTVTGVPAEGAVTFAVDDTQVGSPAVTDSRAAIQIPAGLSVGDHQVTATFVPTDTRELAAGSATATLSITRATTSVVGRASREAVRYGDHAAFLVSVYAPGATPGTDMTGPVTVFDGDAPVAQGTTDSGGNAELAFYNRNHPGQKTYTVTYAGNDAAAPAESAFVLHTTQTNVDINITRPSLKPGESGTVVVSVIGTPDPPTGQATVTMDGTTIAAGALDADGKISAPVAKVSVGSHSIQVSYEGDARFEPRSASATLTVREPIANPNPSGAAAINANNPCPAYAEACINLSARQAWLQSGGMVTYGPVPITSGKKGYRTPAGTFEVFWLHKDHKSSLFDDAPMPNSVFFNNDIAFHAGSLSEQSHGCIHLSYAASEAFFNNLAVGDTVYVYGSAPY